MENIIDDLEGQNDFIEEEDDEFEEPVVAGRGHNLEWFLSVVFETGISA